MLKKCAKKDWKLKKVYVKDKDAKNSQKNFCKDKFKKRLWVVCKSLLQSAAVKKVNFDIHC